MELSGHHGGASWEVRVVAGSDEERRNVKGKEEGEEAVVRLRDSTLLLQEAGGRQLLAAPLVSVQGTKMEGTSVSVMHGAGSDVVRIEFGGEEELSEFLSAYWAALDALPLAERSAGGAGSGDADAASLGFVDMQSTKMAIGAPGTYDIDTLGNGKRIVRFHDVGYTKLVSVEVCAPLVVNSNDTASSSYIVYRVSSKAQFLSKEVREWNVYHRYSDFETLSSQLKRSVENSLEKLEIPALPPKPWIPLGQYGEDWVKTRCKKLNAWLNMLVAERALVENVSHLRLLLRFLSNGELYVPDQGNALASSDTGYVSKVLFKANQGLSKLLDEEQNPSPERDYDYIRKLYKNQKLERKSRSSGSNKLVFPKYVLSVFGTTSAGKSSLINHLLTISCCASSNAGQVDTGYTILEVVEEKVFHDKYLSDVLKNKALPKFSLAELKKPSVPSYQHLQSDKRYGAVFVYLSTAETLERYHEQLGSESGEIADILRAANNIRCVLVNAHYLNGTHEEKQIAQNVIIIDTKGIDASSFVAPGAGHHHAGADLVAGGATPGSAGRPNGIRYLEASIKTMQFFCGVANLVLWMMPAQNIRNCEQAVSLFELGLVSSMEGISFLEKQLNSHAAGMQSKSGQTTIVQTNDVMSGLLLKMLGVNQLYGMASDGLRYLGKKIKSYVLPPKSQQDISNANSRWERIFFVLSKIDQVYSPEGGVGAGGRQNMSSSEGTAAAAQRERKAAGSAEIRLKELQVYYELGAAFARRLHYLEPPAFSRCFTLGLPEKQALAPQVYTGFLKNFKAYLLQQSRENSFERNRDTRLVEMCDELLKSIGSGWISSTTWSLTLPGIRAIKKRALARKYAVE